MSRSVVRVCFSGVLTSLLSRRVVQVDVSVCCPGLVLQGSVVA